MPKDRILIVDDEKNIVSSLTEILNDEGYDITTAEDGLSALERIQSEPPDLVLLDIWIPGMDGIEVLQAIKTYHPEVEVLVMSGHGTIDTAVKATKLGAYDFIEKPFSLNELVQSVTKAFQQKKGRGQGGGKPAGTRKELPRCFDLMVEVKKSVQNAAKSNAPVLIHGEVGTGKEFIAQGIHSKSRKSDLPLIKINCALRSMQKIQSELFETRSKAKPKTSVQKGIGKKAIYLKNIDALSKSLQDKLATALKTGNGRKKTGDPKLQADRLFASSTKDLADLTERGEFNPELCNLLMENIVYVPALKENRALIPSMIKTYIEELEEAGKVPCKNFSEDALQALCDYDWPENFKELRATLDQLARTIHPDNNIGVSDLPPAIHQAPSTTEPVSSGENGSQPLQRTLKRSVVLCGRGLHSGIKTGLIMQPLPPGSGIIFGDISSGETIPAKVENVQSTEYATSLSKGYSSVSTIEHIMAVLHMYRVHNLLIKIGDEAPVMDGSAKDFCQLIEDGDFEIQNEPYEELVIDKTYSFGSPEKGEAHISIEPYDGFKVSYHMEYREPIGVMDYTFEFTGPESFKKEIAPARTFGFVEDVAMLNKMGFGVGGKLDNFILLGDDKVLNTELRYEDEFARHKILDILGDFYLLGKPIRGYIKAYKSGHTQNIGLLKTIQEEMALTPSAI